MDVLSKKAIEFFDSAGAIPQIVGQSFGFVPPQLSHVSISFEEGVTRVRFEDWPEQRWSAIESRFPGEYVVYGSFVSVLSRSLILITRRSIEAVSRDFEAMGRPLPESRCVRLDESASFKVGGKDDGAAITLKQRRSPEDVASSMMERFQSFAEPS